MKVKVLKRFKYATSIYENESVNIDDIIELNDKKMITGLIKEGYIKKTKQSREDKSLVSERNN